MAYDAIIFDLDGTLWDATESIARGWNLGLRELGIADSRVSSQDMGAVAGLPFDQCVAQALPGLGPREWPELPRVLDRHEREAVETEGGRLYPCVTEELSRLGRANELFIVSNCQDWYLEAFLRLSGLADLFSGHECHGRGGRSKSENIALVVGRHRLKRPVYVGDTAGDQRAAREAGVDFCFAAYGFGQPEWDCPAFSSFQSLAAILLAPGAGENPQPAAQ